MFFTTNPKIILIIIFGFYIACMCCAVHSRSVVSNSLWRRGLYPARLLCPRGFPRQEYWSELPCPPPGDLLNSGIEPRSPTLQADSLLSEPLGKPKNTGVGSCSLLWGICQPRDRTQVSCIIGGFFTSWATREAHTCGYPCVNCTHKQAKYPMNVTISAPKL